MNSNTLYINHISRLKRVILKRTFQRFLLSTILIYTPLASITLFIHNKGWIYGDRGELFWIVLVVSFLLALLFIVKKRRTLMDELIDVEARLDLKSRLSTAYEYSQSHQRSLFVDLLIRNACRLLQTIHPKDMFPRVLTRSHLLIPVFMVLFISVLFLDHNPYAFKKMGVEDPILQQISITMKDFIKRESPIMKDGGKPHHEEIYRTMEDIVKELDENLLNREAFTGSVQALARDIKAEQAIIARRVRATLNPGDIANTPMLKPLESATPEADEIRKMAELLKELFHGEIPASLSTDISILERNSRLGPFLDQVLDELRAGRVLKNVPISEMEKKGFLIGKTIPGTEKNNQKTASEEMAVENQALDIIKRDSPSMGPGGADRTGEESDNGLGDVDEPFFPQAGNTKASGMEKAFSEIKNAEGSKIRDPGISLTSERYSAQVRSLTIIGKPNMNETEILRTYEREIENILQKEDIPLNYREYIKNYFLSIGIGREDHANEDAD